MSATATAGPTGSIMAVDDAASRARHRRRYCNAPHAACDGRRVRVRASDRVFGLGLAIGLGLGL
eukprot:343612-Lingulodinium_polyedra.AAC.1